MLYTIFRTKLENFLSNQLEDREATLLRAHLTKCMPCRMIFEDVRSTFIAPLDSGMERDDTSTEIEGYRIIKKLGKGGMGVVYKALQLSMEREVALKVLAKNLATNEAFIQRFMREARAAGQLSHSNLIRVYDFGNSNGTYFFSMEFIDGKNVGEILKSDGKLEIEQSLDIAFKVAGALDYAQESDLIHRDIKPDNIMISTDGDIKVADLGLAKHIGKDRDGSITMAGERLGTPHYMPPEQIRETKDVDHRADIYSLGATLFHMVTGRRPFSGKTSVEIMQNVVTEEIFFKDEELEYLPSEVCDLIFNMMEKNPRRRPQKWKQVIRKIREILKAI